MTLYTADIGTYDRGKNVDLPNARNLKEAISEASRICETIVFDPPLSNPDIVQIYKGTGKDRRIVWDYWNGELS